MPTRRRSKDCSSSNNYRNKNNTKKKETGCQQTTPTRCTQTPGDGGHHQGQYHSDYTGPWPPFHCRRLGKKAGWQTHCKDRLTVVCSLLAGRLGGDCAVATMTVIWRWRRAWCSWCTIGDDDTAWRLLSDVADNCHGVLYVSGHAWWWRRRWLMTTMIIIIVEPNLKMFRYFFKCWTYIF